MIDPNILNVLKSNQDDPSYSIIIKSFNQPEFCNREELQMTILQVNPNVFEIIQNKTNIIESLKELLTDNDIEIPNQYELSINNIVQKTFTVNSVLNFDQIANTFTSGLTGRISAETNQNIPSQSTQGEIKARRIIFTTKDYPNVLDEDHFILNKNNITIKLDEDIQNITVTLTHANLVASYDSHSELIEFKPFVTNTIVDGEVNINITDVRNAVMPTNIISSLTTSISDKENTIIELNNSLEEATEEEKEEIEAEIATLETDILNLTKRKQAIIDQIQGLNFNSTKPFNFDITYTYRDDITNRFIECINFELAPEINIDFLQTYKNVPGLVLTIDEKDKKYSSYSTTFKTNEQGLYNGVTITFNNLKRLREPIDVNVIIMGDSID